MEEKKSTAEIGRTGENEVGVFLETAGWSILEKNFRSRRGEIDIVALKGEILAFIEVKNWAKNRSVDLNDSVTSVKRARIIETSKIFLSKYRQYNWKRIRYDIFFLSSDGKPVWYEGAFDETS